MGRKGNTQGKFKQPHSDCHVVFQFHLVSNHFQKYPYKLHKSFCITMCFYCNKMQMLRSSMSSQQHAI